MVVSEKTSMDRRENQEICTVQKDWGPLVNCKPVLTPDSKHLLAASGCSVKVFSTASGSLIQEFIGHRHKVIGIVQHGNQYITCDAKGEMRTWSSEKQECLEKVRLLEDSSQNTGQVVAFQIMKECQQVLLLVKKTSKKKGLLMKFSRPFGKGGPVVLAKDVQLGQGKMGVSNTDDYIAYLTADSLSIAGNGCTVAGKAVLRHMAGTRPFTCLVWNPRQEMLATGDITGRIVLWYNLINTVPAQTVLHWHTLPVEDLAFSVLGNELYSGGGECVLVKWLLPEDRRHYLPRLGMPIKTITTDVSNNLVITGHTDNAFTVIASKTNKVQGNIQDLSINLESSESFPAGIVFDPKTGAVVLNGRTGHVQLYDIHHNKQLFHLDITQTNYITQERHQVIYNTQVIRMAMSADGLWLATVEYRDDFQTSIEQRVKFWHYSIVDQNWYLDTSVEMPHDKSINSIVFKPSSGSASSPEFVTCSDDGKFKVWEIIKDANIYRECIMNDARVYRMEAFASMTANYCNLLIPAAVTSEEKQVQQMKEEQLRQTEMQRKKTKKLAKKKKKDLERVPNANFSELLEMQQDKIPKHRKVSRYNKTGSIRALKTRSLVLRPRCIGEPQSQDLSEGITVHGIKRLLEVDVVSDTSQKDMSENLTRYTECNASVIAADPPIAFLLPERFLRLTNLMFLRQQNRKNRQVEDPSPSCAGGEHSQLSGKRLTFLRKGKICAAPAPVKGAGYSRMPRRVSGKPGAATPWPVGTLASFEVKLDKSFGVANKYGRGGQSQKRSARLADESRLNHLKAVYGRMEGNLLDGNSPPGGRIVGGPGPHEDTKELVGDGRDHGDLEALAELLLEALAGSLVAEHQPFAAQLIHSSGSHGSGLCKSLASNLIVCRRRTYHLVCGYSGTCGNAPKHMEQEVLLHEGDSRAQCLAVARSRQSLLHSDVCYLLAWEFCALGGELFMSPWSSAEIIMATSSCHPGLQLKFSWQQVRVTLAFSQKIPEHVKLWLFLAFTRHWMQESAILSRTFRSSRSGASPCVQAYPAIQAMGVSNTDDTLHISLLTAFPSQAMDAPVRQGSVKTQGRHTAHHQPGVEPRQERAGNGDITGRIVLWYNLINLQFPKQTVLLWHTLPVEDLAFSVLAFTVIASKTNKVQGNIQDLSINLESSESFPAGIVFDPKTGAVVLNGKGRERSALTTFITTNSYSTWYLTNPERCHRQKHKQHRLQAFPGSASSPEFVTCSDDGKFKVWEIIKDANIYRKSDFWSCTRVGFYRHLPATAVNMSHDGSLIAAGFANILTLWLPQSCHLKGTLSQPYLKEHIKQIEFGRGEGCGSLLVTRTDSWICSWDLFTCTLSWRVGLQSTCMAADPRSSHMAVFSKDCCVFIFEPSSSEPICGNGTSTLQKSRARPSFPAKQNLTQRKSGTCTAIWSSSTRTRP
ncbi:LOW QUALITY PROTEIN: uncharacterized protein LOC119599216 [Penaeus monodon]|uniref:LOW QUALITY PROTEIN: uncharacterized protein LOC119599216 n=1 Tax=Penaeus monodon TaxID=6687 RepID=UPI0018A75FAF|nr:LOW QUALITY PROTEIN: uncharacterized protein LOC119599216 [Penaeus monodon]